MGKAEGALQRGLGAGRVEQQACGKLAKHSGKYRGMVAACQVRQTSSDHAAKPYMQWAHVAGCKTKFEVPARPGIEEGAVPNCKPHSQLQEQRAGKAGWAGGDS
jgi:hypothetical protein